MAFGILGGGVPKTGATKLKKQMARYPEMPRIRDEPRGKEELLRRLRASTSDSSSALSLCRCPSADADKGLPLRRERFLEGCDVCACVVVCVHVRVLRHHGLDELWKL